MISIIYFDKMLTFNIQETLFDKSFPINFVNFCKIHHKYDEVGKRTLYYLINFSLMRML
jgi:hypothetical protein